LLFAEFEGWKDRDNAIIVCGKGSSVGNIIGSGRQDSARESVNFQELAKRLIVVVYLKVIMALSGSGTILLITVLKALYRSVERYPE